MTMTHIRKDKKHQTAHTAFLDLPMDDSSVVALSMALAAKGKGRVNRGSG